MMNFSAPDILILQYQKLQDNPKDDNVFVIFFSYAVDDNTKGSIQLLKKQDECKRYFIEVFNNFFNNFLSRQTRVQTQ